MLTICTWLWGRKYDRADVAKLAAGVRRHLHQPYQFMVVSEEYFEDWPQGVVAIPLIDDDLTKVKGCFARLRLFDPKWINYLNLEHRHHLAEIEDRLVCMDLDTVITGDLDPLFNRAETFMILQGANAANPCPFNGSLMMLRAGAHPEVWTDFSITTVESTLRAAGKVYEFADDQGWLWHKMPNAGGWKVGSQSGVYAFQKPGWPKADGLPADARLVVFPGWRSPEKFKHLPWVKKHWQ